MKAIKYLMLCFLASLVIIQAQEVHDNQNIFKTTTTAVQVEQLQPGEEESLSQKIDQTLGDSSEQKVFSEEIVQRTPYVTKSAKTKLNSYSEDWSLEGIEGKEMIISQTVQSNCPVWIEDVDNS